MHDYLNYTGGMSTCCVNEWSLERVPSVRYGGFAPSSTNNPSLLESFKMLVEKAGNRPGGQAQWQGMNNIINDLQSTGRTSEKQIMAAMYTLETATAKSGCVKFNVCVHVIIAAVLYGSEPK